MNKAHKAVTDAGKVPRRQNINIAALALHLSGCVAVALAKGGEVSGPYPTQAIAKMIEKEISQFEA